VQRGQGLHGSKVPSAMTVARNHRA
jgi:hypothetical protein